MLKTGRENSPCAFLWLRVVTAISNTTQHGSPITAQAADQLFTPRALPINHCPDRTDPSLLTLSLQFKQSYLENIIVSPDYDNQLPYN